MAQNLTQPSPYENEIDFREIFKILLESKKLIISSILIFTIASIIYSLSLKPEFKSSTILEIGYYEMSDGTLELIEKPKDIISNIRTNLIYKKRDNFLLENLIIESPENKLIELKLTSKSSKKNVDILSEITNYIDARHSSLSALISDQKKHQISNEIDLINSEISFIKEKQLDNNELKRSEIEDRIAKLKTLTQIIDLEISQLGKVIIDDNNNLSLLKKNNNILTERAAISPTLEQIIFNYKTKINSLNIKKSTNIIEVNNLNNKLKILENVTLRSDELFSLEQERKILDNELQLLMTRAQVKTLPIGNIETQTIKPKTLLTILLSIIMGFITGILLVFIRNFKKSFRESEA